MRVGLGSFCRLAHCLSESDWRRYCTAEFSPPPPPRRPPRPPPSERTLHFRQSTSRRRRSQNSAGVAAPSSPIRRATYELYVVHIPWFVQRARIFLSKRKVARLEFDFGTCHSNLPGKNEYPHTLYDEEGGCQVKRPCTLGLRTEQNSLSMQHATSVPHHHRAHKSIIYVSIGLWVSGARVRRPTYSLRTYGAVT